MEPVSPVTTGFFPKQRSARRGNASYEFVDAEEEQDEKIDLRLSRPLANIPMLLEILSKAGEPANKSGQTVVLHRRWEDRANKQDRSQYTLPL